MKKFAKILTIVCISVLICVLLAAFLNLRGSNNSITKDPAQYKNVILLIGDGMGQNTLKTALAEDSTPLFMQTMPVHGESKTNSWPGFILTDSAAGGTALASGIRTINGMLGRYALDPQGWVIQPASLSEIALKHGRSAGVVTTDSTSGATPTAFSGHSISRNKEEEISESQLVSGLNLIWGGASDSVTKENTKANGFAYVDNKTDWDALDSASRSFAQFSGDDLAGTLNTQTTPTLEEMTVKAIDLLDDNSRGFFLMVEGAHIDKFAHANEKDPMVHHVREFDKAIKAAMDYADAHPDTLVLVTADHETGGLTLIDGKYEYTSGGHTKANVPVYVNRTDAGFEHGGAWKNREIGAQLGRVLGFGKKVFPKPIGS